MLDYLVALMLNLRFMQQSMGACMMEFTAGPYALTKVSKPKIKLSFSMDGGVEAMCVRYSPDGTLHYN